MLIFKHMWKVPKALSRFTVAASMTISIPDMFTVMLDLFLFFKFSTVDNISEKLTQL